MRYKIFPILKFCRLLKMCLLFSVAILVGNFSCAEISLCDPKIPDGEEITYNLYVGEDSEVLVEKTAIKKEADGKVIYEITSRSKFENRQVKIAKEAMLPFYVHCIKKTKGIILEEKLTLIEEKSKTEKYEIKIMDFSSLRYVLRGFPFAKLKPLRITIVKEEKPFTVEVKVFEIENLEVRGKSINCYKLEVGQSGLMKFISPKIYFWYSFDAPHYLVHYDGTAGLSEFPQRAIELVDYSGYD